MYHLVISCFRLPGPISHTSAGACGWKRRKRVLKLIQRDVCSSHGRLGVKSHMTSVSNFFCSAPGGAFQADAAGRRCR